MYQIFIMLFFLLLKAHQIRSRHEDLEKAIETSEEEKYAYWLVTLLAWLLPTLVIVGGLLDGLFVFILWKEKQPKEKVEGEEKTSKMQKFLRLLRYLLLLINRIGTKVVVFLPVMIAMTYYYEATSSLNRDTLSTFNATSKLLEKNMPKGHLNYSKASRYTALSCTDLAGARF